MSIIQLFRLWLGWKPKPWEDPRRSPTDRAIWLQAKPKSLEDKRVA